MGTVKDSEQTRARVTEAAGRLFAERGFKAVTVRDIAREAGTHLSAVNYHFRDKESLYRVVLREALATRVGPDLLAAADAAEPQAALRALLTAIAADYLRDQGWKSRLVLRELLDPTPDFSEALEETFMPLHRALAAALARAGGRDPSDPRVRLNALLALASIDALMTYGPLLAELVPDLAGRLADPAALAGELAETYLAAVGPPPRRG